MPYRPGDQDWSSRQLLVLISRWLDEKKPGEIDGAFFMESVKLGRCLLILDGVDEVPELMQIDGQTSHPRESLLCGLADALPGLEEKGNRVLLTSRPYGLNNYQRNRLSLEKHTLQPMGDDLQQLFVKRWYRATRPALFLTLSEGLMEELDKRGELSELRVNPLLLTACCVAYANGKRLPKDIYALYDKLVNQVLYSRYQDSPISRDPARQYLGAIALGMHTGKALDEQRSTPKAQIGFDEMDAILGDFARDFPYSETGSMTPIERRSALLEASGLLSESGDKEGRFFHLSFQDFLAADRLLKLRVPLENWFDRYGHVDGWRQTLLFLFAGRYREEKGGAMSALQSIISALDDEKIIECPQKALLIGQCLETCPDGFNLGEVGRRFSAVADHVLHNMEDPYFLSRYLVTNHQFSAFVESESGYVNGRWWDSCGDQKKLPKRSTWSDASCPRTDVNWYEATAFCRWLSVELGFTIRLPNEAEWQWAGSGENLDAEYPWGNGYQSGYANVREDESEGRSNLWRTSPVGLYSKGEGKLGLSDMSGNVDEWCGNKFEMIDDVSVDARVGVRSRDHPGNRRQRWFSVMLFPLHPLISGELSAVR